MIRVNIVVIPADMDWIGGRFARELVARLPKYGVAARINDWGFGCDLEYQQIVYGPPTRRPAVGLFTHGEVRPKRYGLDYDGQLVLNPAMLGYLREAGASHATIVRQPVEDRYRLGRPLVFGVAGRTYQDGRKGEHLVRALVEHGYSVIGWGSGWPCPIVSCDLADLPDFYRSLDYYIDTSSDEGGCTPALEAMAMGVPVISHTIGVIHPVIPYRTHDVEDLLRVVGDLQHLPGYDYWAQRHADYFAETLARVGEEAVAS